MYVTRLLLQLAVTPAFLVLAAVAYCQPSPLCAVPGPYGFLTSMWFMYLMMAAAHAGIWLPVIAKRFAKGSSARPALLEPCCDVPSREAAGRRDQHAQRPPWPEHSLHNPAGSQ